MPDRANNPSPTAQVQSLLAEGKHDEALKAATAALVEAREHSNEGDERNAMLCQALHILGDVQREMHQIVGAEASYREGLELAGDRPDLLGERARLRMQLATLLDFNEREADAAPVYEQAAADFEALTPPDDVTAAQLRNNLAMIYKGLGKFALAEQHYLRSLEVIELRMGRESEAVASVYNNLGSLYYTAGFADEALKMFKEGLVIREKMLGPDHTDVAQSLSNIATARHELGDNMSALLDFERALRILEASVKEKASSYEAVGGDYIALLEALNQERRAEAFQKRMQKVLATLA
ncbi:MAG: tetratricopeptide repeat protein [Verrucomicrobiota bacterium]